MAAATMRLATVVVIAVFLAEVGLIADVTQCIIYTDTSLDTTACCVAVASLTE